MSDIVLKLDRVGVRFGGLDAVADVSIAIDRGERRAVIGPNGAGKTTLFNAITGVVPPSSGRIYFDDHDVTKAPPQVRARLGMSRTFQITNLFPSLTVAENMELSVRGVSARKFSMFGSADPSDAEAERTDRALRAARLHERRNALVMELSYGEQRQLEMAMALAMRPKLLLLDEPAAGLSVVERGIVSDVIRSLSRELTVVLIEHDMDLVLALVDRVTCLDNGRLLAEGSPADIRANQHVQDVYLGKARHRARSH